MELTDETLISIGMGCKHLTEVEFGRIPKIKVATAGNEKLTTSGLEGLLKNCQCLTHFDFSPHWSFPNSDKVFLFLGTYCPALEFLSLTNVEVSGTYADVVAQGCTNLNFIELYEVIGIAAGAFLESLGTNCHQLQEFHCCYDDRDEVDDRSFQAFAMGCPLLETFGLQNHSISHQAIRSSVEYCPFLSKLDFAGCVITNDCLTEIGKLRNLNIIDMSWCKTLTDDGISDFVKSQPSLLEEIDLRSCVNLTDASCINIANACPQLKSIHFEYSQKQITSAGMIFLFSKCKHLIDIAAPEGIVPDIIKEELDKRRLASLQE